jgi:hypothetical protein
MIPKISSISIIGGKTGKNTMSHAEFQLAGGGEGFLRALRPDINGA